MVYSGPILMRSLIKEYSNNQLIASNITVTPKLDIKIGRLEYALRDADGKIYQKGFSRSIDINWSVLNTKPFLHAQIGPTFVENFLTFDDLNFRLPSLSAIDFQDIFLSGEIDNLEIHSIGKTYKLNLEAIYNRKRHLLTDVLVDMPSAGAIANQNWGLSGVTAKINEINLTTPIDAQKIKLAVSADNINNHQQDIQMINPLALLDFSSGETTFKIEAQAAKLSEREPALGTIEAEGVYSKNKFLENIHFVFTRSLNEIWSNIPPSIVFDVKKVEGSIYDFQVTGDIDPFEMTIGENFIGNIPASNFEINLNANSMTSHLNLMSRLNFKNFEGPKITASARMKARLDDLKNILNCFTIGCEISELSLEYEVNSQQEWLLGTSTCLSNKCSLSSMSHNFKTSNTAELFTIINQSKILNPIYSVYLYSLLSAGTKVDKGHEIKIN